MTVMVTQPVCNASILHRMMAVFILALLFLSAPAYAQNSIQVQGKVTAQNGDPVIRASVGIKGTAVGTNTDENGGFRLTASPDAILVVSSIGYVTKEVPVNGQANITVVLTSSSTDLEAVMVVGYGTQRKRDVTGSVVSVSESELREVPAANLQMALQGRAAGLEIQRVGTRPGAGALIRIRGERSIFGSNDPLIVLDGIPFEGGSLNDINPDDVSSVDVLKDASATAIYGSRGANGVILVSTKKGRTGPAHVSYNGYYGIGSVAKKYDVYSPEEYRAMRDLSTWNQGYLAPELESIATGRSTDWQDLIYENSRITDHNISVYGGNDGSTFSLGGGYFNETAVLPGQDFTRYSLRATIDAKIGKRVRMGLNTMNTLSHRDGNQFPANMFPLLTLSPLMPAYDEMGGIVRSPAGNLDDKNTYSPLLLKSEPDSWVDRVRRLRTFNTLYGEVQIIDGLKYRLNVGLDYRQEEGAQFRGSDSYFRPAQGNQASVNNGEGWGYTLEHILSCEKTFAEKHKITFTGLYSFQEDRSHSTSVAKDSIDAEFIKHYNLGLASTSAGSKAVVGGTESTWALISYMARVNYVFDDRFMLTLTGRIDGSSRLAVGNKFHQYPAISAGWNISNEPFMQRLGFISNLKLRAGYGQTSNQAINPYASLGLVSPSNGLNSPANSIRYNYGPTVVTGYNITTLPNPALEWEYTATTNIGLDFGFLDSRITGAIDWYKANTNNVLYDLTLPSTSGVNGRFATNIGEISNTGLEVTVSSANIRSRSGFTWNTDLNIFYNRNKLVRLNDGFVRNIGNGLHVGYALSSIYDFRKLGIWQQSEAAEAAKYKQTPGQLKIEDVSGPEGKPDNIIHPDHDRMIIGKGEADWQGGITNRFGYKGFDLSFVVYARMGGTLISQLHQPSSAYLTVLDGKRNGLRVDYWTPTNPTNAFPMPQANIAPPDAPNSWSTLGYYDASFVRVRSINFGYTLSPKALDRIKAQTVRIYVTAQNPFILYSPYVQAGGIDPEATNQGNNGVGDPGNIRGGSNGLLTISASTPPTRSFILGMNLTF